MRGVLCVGVRRARARGALHPFGNPARATRVLGRKRNRRAYVRTCVRVSIMSGRKVAEEDAVSLGADSVRSLDDEEPTAEDVAFLDNTVPLAAQADELKALLNMPEGAVGDEAARIWEEIEAARAAAAPVAALKRARDECSEGAVGARVTAKKPRK